MATEREKLFGNDLRVIREGAAVDVAGSLDLGRNLRGDLERAEGNDNLVQALVLRLLVRQGELAALGWPDYGSRLHELIGEPNNARTHVRMMAFARSAVERDPRVLQVADLRARVSPADRNVVRLEMEVQAIDEQNPLNLVFDLAL